MDPSVFTKVRNSKRKHNQLIKNKNFEISNFESVVLILHKHFHKKNP